MAHKTDLPADEMSQAELLSFQQQAEQIEKEKAAKRAEREERKRLKELKKKQELQAKFVAPILFILTIVISLVIWVVYR